MNVLIVQNSVKTCLLFRKDYIENLISDGHSVKVLAPKDDDLSLVELNNLGVDVVGVKPSTNKIMTFFNLILFNLNFLKHGYKSDKICCHFLVTLVFLFFVAPIYSFKTIVFVEGLGSFFGDNIYFCKFIKYYLKSFRFKRVFCNSDERMRIGTKNDMVLGGIGINTEYFMPLEKSLHRNYGSMLYVGRILKDKGFGDAISSLKIMLNSGMDIRLNVAGSIYPSNPSSLTEDDVTDLKLEFGDNIKFHGYVRDTRDLYRGADVLLLPSKREGFPVCVMEASSVGIPSIVYDVPGSSDAIAHMINGIIVKNLSSSEYSEVVEDFFRFNKYKFNYKIIRKYAVDNFDIKNKSQMILSIIYN